MRCAVAIIEQHQAYFLGLDLADRIDFRLNKTILLINAMGNGLSFGS